MNRAMSFARLLSGYLAVPLLNAVSPLLALPAITAVHSGAAWAAVAIGQSVGGAGGVIVELGWGLSGTQRAARQSERNRARAFALSIVTKAMVSVPVLLVACALTVLLSPGFGAESALVAIGAVLGMFAGGWIFIGIMRPRLFLLTEVLPRALLILGAALAISLGGSLLWYSCALVVASLFASVSGAAVLGVRAGDFVAVGFRRCIRIIGMQGHALAANVFSSVYISLGVTVATLGSPHSTLLFATVDRLQRMTQQVLFAQNSLMKGWVGTVVDPAARLERARRMAFLASVLGVVFGAAFALGSPLAADVVFSGTVHIPAAAAVIGGASIWVICTSMASGGVLLVTLGRVDAIARSALGGAVVGVPLIFLGSMFGGGTGALGGQLAAETTVLVIQVVTIAAVLRRRRAALVESAPASS
ncbi:hypothetical protein ACRAWC_05455 [Leifsonia sp. L25]|uniref:hypothetical protein n=1 Tax=Actinomycetes TaxID=1760 RepID=UPI003D68138A